MRKFRKHIARLLLFICGMNCLSGVVPSILSIREVIAVEQDVPEFTVAFDLPDATSTMETVSLLTLSGSSSVGVVEKAVTEINRKTPESSTTAVTEIYSVNNEIHECYYKPLRNEIYLLDEFVMQNGFASAYSGFFDLNRTSPNTGRMERRALEILGYDFLLSSESYDGSKYVAERVTDVVSRQTAVMDVYKAVGKEIQEIKCFYSAVDKDKLVNSPVIKDLPGLVGSIDCSRGQTKVFVTRSNPEHYADKAKRELHLTPESVSGSTITLGEFMVLVAAAMDYYGEPVISTGEMNALLQVFGGDIPSSLEGSQQTAYVYLRSRGILTGEESGFTSALKLDQMLEILMRVQDKDSRVDLKSMQVSISINDSLSKDGFFPKAVSINAGGDAVQVEQSYYYEEAVHYDYFIEKSSTGFSSDRLYIPADILKPEGSEGLRGSAILGVEEHGGKEYYHIQILPTAVTAAYFEKTMSITGMPESFVVMEDVSGKMYAMAQGGGVYTAQEVRGNLTLSERENFSTKEFDGYVDDVRKKSGNTAKGGMLAGLANIAYRWFTPMAVHAVDDIVTFEDYNPAQSSVRVKLVIYNASNIDRSNDPSVNIPVQVGIYDAAAINDVEDTMEVVLPQYEVRGFLARIKRTNGLIEKNPAVPAIALVSGQTMIPYSYLVSAGLVYDTKEVLGGESYNPDILVLDTKNGRVVLNNESHMVVTGSTVYRTINTPYLFRTDVVKQELYVDFRAIYGWSSGIVNTVITGTGDGYAINIENIENDGSGSSKYRDVYGTNIRMPHPFEASSLSVTSTGLFVRRGIVNDNYLMLMTSNYTLGNWVVYEGTSEDVLYVFYHKDMFKGRYAGITVPSDMAEMKNKMHPCKCDEDTWVVRGFPLTKTRTSEEGKMTYIEGYGYCYNIPTADRFTLEDYLAGSILLPIYNAGDENRDFDPRNANVNIWDGMDYGLRPLEHKFTGGSVDCVDIKGNAVSVTTTGSTLALQAVPACVQVFYGGADVLSTKAENVNMVADDEYSSSSFLNKTTVVYYGTSKVTLGKMTNGEEVYAMLKLPSGSFNGNSYSEKSILLRFKETDYIYNVMRVKNWNNQNAGSEGFCTVYIGYNAVMKESVASEEYQKEIERAVEIMDGEQENIFSGFEDFSIEYLITKIDDGASVILLFTLTVLPLLGITALLLIGAFVFECDNKFVRLVIEKTFDPIKFLTFGNKTFDTISRRTALFCMLGGCSVFVLVMNGNLLRIIMWVSKGFMAFVGLLRQM